MKGGVILLGTPAEEMEGGKIDLLKFGAFETVDFAMMVHPTRETQVHMTALAMSEYRVVYRGVNAHASGNPEEGVNALDAAVQAYTSISCMRQQLPDAARVHGIITKGGSRPNIIPDLTEMHYYVRGVDKAMLEAVVQKVRPCWEAAATATGCSVQIEQLGESLLNVVTNRTLADIWTTYYESLSGEKIPSVEEQLKMPSGSTDFGNVTYARPGAHPCYAIGGTGANHTAEFADQVVTEQSHVATRNASKAMALTCLQVMASDKLLAKVKDEFVAKFGNE